MNSGINLNGEYKDLARYFRLSILRDRGVITPQGLQEIDDIVNRCARVKTIEDTINDYKEGKCSVEEYNQIIAVNRDALEAAIMNTALNDSPKDNEMSEEFKDLARYFRLSVLRNNGDLSEEEYEELDEIVERNDRALVIERARKKLLDDEITLEEYEQIYSIHRDALSNEIKRVYEDSDEDEGGESNRVVITEEPVSEDPTELSQEFSDLSRYFSLSILRNNGQLPPEGIQELNELTKRSKRNYALEEARRRLMNKELAPEEYEEFYKKQREDLSNAINKVEKARREANKIPKEKEDKKSILSNEFRDLAKYFRLSMLRDQNMLPPSGLKELKEIVSKNERAKEVENAKNELENNNLNREDYDKVVGEQRAALSEEIKKVNTGNNTEVKEVSTKKEYIPKKGTNTGDLDKYKKAIKALKVYQEFSADLNKLGFKDINDLKAFLGLRTNAN